MKQFLFITLYSIFVFLPCAHTQSYIYWSTWLEDRVARGNQDGTGQVQIASTAGPLGIAIDKNGGNLFFCHFPPHNAIYRKNLDGSGSSNDVFTQAAQPEDITLNSLTNTLYYTDTGNGTIVKINTNGTGKSVVLSGLNNPQGIDCDEASGALYWVDYNDLTINSVNSDGTNAQTLITLTNPPKRIALDQVNQKLYWVERTSDLIRRADYDGSNVTTIASISLSTGIAIDNVNNKIYWNERGSNSIKRMNFDGTAIETVFNVAGLSDIDLDIDDPCEGPIVYSGQKIISSQADLDNFLDENGCKYTAVDYLVFENNTTDLDLSNLSEVEETIAVQIIFNSGLTTFDGLNKLHTVETIDIGINNVLSNISGFGSLTQIDNGAFRIYANPLLQDISVFEAIDPSGISIVEINNNDLLAFCSLSNICTFLSDGSNPSNISNNAEGCDTRTEITGICVPYCLEEDCYPEIDVAIQLANEGDVVTVYHLKDQIEDISYEEDQSVTLSFKHADTDFSGIYADMIDNVVLALQYTGTGTGNIVADGLNIVSGTLTFENTENAHYTLGSPADNINIGDQSGNSGTLSISTSSDVTLAGTTTLYNSSILEVGAGRQLLADALLHVNANSTLDNFGNISIMDVASFSGQYNDHPGSTSTILPGAVVSWATESTYQLDGSLTIDGFIDFQGTLKGNGVVDGPFVAPSSATINPGASAGILQFNDDLSLEGTLVAEIAGTDGAGMPNGHDQIQVAGTASINDATLDVQLIDGYQPSPGEQFQIMTFNATSGTGFSSVHLPSCCNWDLVVEPDEVYISVLSILPVTFMEFTALPEQDKVRLHWETASELNNQGFEIQRSKNAVDWKKIGFEEGVGTSNQTTIYEFFDQAPYSGTNYYRLKQSDFDGAFKYSAIVAINWTAGTKNGLVSFAPNPFNDELRITSNMDTKVEMKLYDVAGKHLKTIELDALSSFTVETSNLESGVYLLKMTNGVATDVARVVKHY